MDFKIEMKFTGGKAEKFTYSEFRYLMDQAVQKVKGNPGGAYDYVERRSVADTVVTVETKISPQ